MTPPPYVPLACGLHDELLDIATRRRRVEVRYRDDAGAAVTATVTIDDVFTRGAEEFARLGDGKEVRLDRLVAVEGTRIGSGG